MGYVEDNLIGDERIVAKARISWSIYLPGIGIALLAAICAMESMFLPLAALLMLFAIYSMSNAYIYAISTELAVTNERIIVKTGFIRRTTMELLHEKVEGMTLDQSLLGRIFNFGTLYIHGTGGGRTPIRSIDDPLEYRKVALEAVEQFKDA